MAQIIQLDFNKTNSASGVIDIATVQQSCRKLKAGLLTLPGPRFKISVFRKIDGICMSLVAKFECNKTIFVGFLDGINSSLKTEMDLDAVTEETAIDLDIDFEKLFFNMLKAEAEYLFTHNI